MKNNKLLKKQKSKFLIYNLIAFFIIFAALGLVAVAAIDGFFYSDADRELDFTRSLLTEKNRPPKPPGQGDVHDRPGTVGNPRIHYIIYAADMTVHEAGINDYLDYSTLRLPTETEKRYNVKLGLYNYRVLEFSFADGGADYYVQTLINIDGEIALRNNILNIYLICLGGISILTVAASYIMSTVTMKPISKSMDEQNRFISDASHEIRTPLTVLHSRLEQLLSFPDARIQDKSEDIASCLSEVIRLTRLSNSLLTLAKSDAGKIPQCIEVFDITDITRKVAQPYIETASFQEKHFTVSGQPLDVSADKAQIVRLLVILFDNAIKYTKRHDKITVTISPSKNKCELTVSDTGIGISEDSLGHIFERFYRGDASRGESEGSGLGLSIAKQIAEEHGGSITARNNPPKGTKITVVF